MSSLLMASITFLTSNPSREQSAADDEGAVGVDDEFDIYEDLNLDAILVAAGAEDGIVTSLDPTGTLPTSHFLYH